MIAELNREDQQNRRNAAGEYIYATDVRYPSGEYFGDKVIGAQSPTLAVGALGYF